MEWQAYKTPCYVIDLERFRKNCMEIKRPFEEMWESRVEFGYSVKTNHDKNLMRYAAEQLGWYIETVSPAEYEDACAVTVPGRIIFNGPCKGAYLKKAYEAGSMINLDHLSEVEELCGGAYGKDGGAEIGIRLNFDLESLCPGETTAGDSVSRFGICYENGDFAKAVGMLRAAGIEPAGIHLHTSTKSRSARVFRMLARKAAEVIREFDLKLSYVDMGGGFFGGQKVAGKPEMKEYAQCICDELRQAVSPQETRLILEPGASVLATSVWYLSRVINVREIRGTEVATLDGTLLHINPFFNDRVPPYRLYRNEETAVRARRKKQIVCGSTCMENDRFLERAEAEALCEGDLFEFHAAGAYTMAFNSQFILRTPEVYVRNEEVKGRPRYIVEAETGETDAENHGDL